MNKDALFCLSKINLYTSKITTGLRCATSDYVTIVAQASAKISGFNELYKDMERSMSVSGKSRSILTNYRRQLAYLVLNYNCVSVTSTNTMLYVNKRKHTSHIRATECT